MTTPAALINLLAFITGAALYGMLLVMALDQLRASDVQPGKGVNRLPLLTALLGLAWNIGGLATYGLLPLSQAREAVLFPLLVAAAFTALGYLPAVVVHSVLRTGEAWQRQPAALGMIGAAYSLSTAASALHFYQAVAARDAPSHWALHLLTAGFAALIVALLVVTRGQPGQLLGKRAGWVAALAVFAVSAAHLSHHEGQDYSWWVELIGHHASLPLVALILYLDYRFALADLFLKRALALVLLVALAFGLYAGVAAPLGQRWQARALHPLSVGLLVGLWVLTALLYPLLWRAVVRFVDAVILRRADYEAMRARLAQRLAACESDQAVIAEISARLAEALTARAINWRSATEQANSAGKSGPLLPVLNQAKTARRSGEPAPALMTVLIPTSEAPQYQLLVGELAAGRRLLSDDQALLETVALMAARRIDAVRVMHERCARDLQEQEMLKLATEAELRALRAQVNPHFLFNALTTIGYLIQTAPERALQTLLRLSALLRGVLRKGANEFCTLGEELDLIEAYLEIERARFEDRLRVSIDVPYELRAQLVPALLLQPLVENAIKHGIAPARAGGAVLVEARQQTSATGESLLTIRVSDTGLGASEQKLLQGREHGVGLANVEQRLKRQFGAAAQFSLRSVPHKGTTVELSLPCGISDVATNAGNGARSTIG
jgi:two-component system LytT family sensor kinase